MPMWDHVNTCTRIEGWKKLNGIYIKTGPILTPRMSNNYICICSCIHSTKIKHLRKSSNVNMLSEHIIIKVIYTRCMTSPFIRK